MHGLRVGFEVESLLFVVQAMLGAQQFLQTVRPSYIVTEVSPMSEGENGVTASEYIQYVSIKVCWFPLLKPSTTLMF